MKCEPVSFFEPLVKISDWINLRIENRDARKASSSGSFSGADQVRTGGLVTLQGLLRDGHSPPQRVRSTCTCRMTSQVFRISYFGQHRLKKWPLLERLSMVGVNAVAVDGECWWQNQGAETAGNYHLSLHIEGLGVCMHAPTSQFITLCLFCGLEEELEASNQETG